jgi:hypothetical protein
MATPIVAQTPDELFAAAKARIEGFRTQSTKGYDDAIASTQGYAQDTAVGGNLSFMDWFNELNRNAANLDVDFAQSDLGSDFLSDQDYLSRSADGALSTDLAYFEKMRLLQDDLYNQVLQEMANNKAMGLYDPPVIEEEVSSSGGGGGGGGGSSSSSDDGPYDTQTGELLGDRSFKETATSDEIFWNPAYMRDEGILTESMIAIKDIYLSTEGGAQDATAAMQEDILKAEAFRRIVSDPRYVDNYDEMTQAERIEWDYYNTQSNNLTDLYTLVQYGQERDPNFGPTVTREKIIQSASWDANDIEGVPYAERDDAITPDGLGSGFDGVGAQPDPNTDPRDPRFGLDMSGNPMVGAGQVDNISSTTPIPTSMPGAGDRDPRPSIQTSSEVPYTEPNRGFGGSPVGQAIQKVTSPWTDALGITGRPDDLGSPGFRGEPEYDAVRRAIIARTTEPEAREAYDSYRGKDRGTFYNPVEDQQNQFGTDQSMDGPARNLGPKQVSDPYAGNYLTVGQTPQQMQAPEVQDNTSVFSQAFNQAKADKKMRDEQAVMQAAAEARAKKEEFANQASLRAAAQARAAANNASYNRNRNAQPNGPVRGLPTPGAGDRDPRFSNPKPKNYVPGNVR